MSQVQQGYAQVALDDQGWSDLLQTVQQCTNQESLMRLAAHPALLNELHASWNQPLSPEGVSVLTASELVPYQPCSSFFVQTAARLSCVVFIILNDLGEGLDAPLYVVPGSHQWLRPFPVESAAPLTDQPYWSTLIRGRGLALEPLQPQANRVLIVHPDLLVGRPLQRCFNGEARVLAIGYAAAQALHGRLDHCWSLGEQRLLLAGWFTDTREQACITVVDADRREHLVSLGTARLDRPDVPVALGVSGDGANVGFLVAVELPGITQVRFGDKRQAVQVSSLHPWDSAESVLDVLVDACHWGTTPPERLPSLLNHGLGKALCWLREQPGVGLTPTEAVACSEGSERVVLELGHDRQFARWRLLQLQQQPRVRSGELDVQVHLVGPFHHQAEPALPDWLISLGQQCGVILHPFQSSGVWHDIELELDPLPDHWLAATPTSVPGASRRSWLQTIEAWAKQ